MFRAIWFLLKIAALVAVIGWLAQYPGAVEIDWMGYEVTTSVGVLLAAVVFTVIFFTYLDRLWRAFVAIPDNIRRAHAASRREKGYRTLTEGLVAVAAGDARGAEKKAQAAGKLVPETPLTKLLSAQAALLNGNVPRARREFAALLDDGEAAFFGVRGLLTEAVKDKDYAEALALIRRAEDMQPKRKWVVRTRFDMETRNGHWQEALYALRRAVGLGAIDAQTAARHRQVLELALAEDALGISDAAGALRHAERAFGESHGFAPAALLLSRLYRDADKDRAARKTILKAWKAAPHPDLAVAWRGLMPATKKPLSVYERGQDVYEWVQKLAQANPVNRESQRALGAAALDASLWHEARAHLLKASDYRLLARLERAEGGNDVKAREWLEKAADNPREPQWVCAACGHAAAQWDVLCPACREFNKQEWVIPQADAVARPLIAAAPAVFEGEIISPPALS